MTIWQPISKTVTQYVDTNGNPYSGAVLKAYLAGTTTVTNIATSSTGGTQVTSVALNASGYPAVSGDVIIPHISADYKISLYPTQTAADANSGALWTIDNLPINFDNYEVTIKDATNSRELNNILFPIRSVKDFGATGDGSTDDRTAINNCLAQIALDGGGTCYFSDGDYAISGRLNITSSNVTLLFDDNARLLPRDSTGFILISCEGSDATSFYGFSADSLKNSHQITTSNAIPDAVIGSWLSIRSTALLAGTNNKASKQKVYRKITGISGTTYTLDKVLKYDFLTTDTAEAGLATFYENISLKGVKLNKENFNHKMSIGVSFKNVANVLIDGIEIYGTKDKNAASVAGRDAIKLEDCQNCYVYRVKASHIAWYGVDCGGASDKIIVDGGEFNDIRHAQDCNHAGSVDTFNGECNDISFLNLTVNNSTESGFSTHDIGRDIIFSNCKTFYAGRITAGSYGFYIRNLATRIFDCKAYYSASDGFRAEDSASSIYFTNCEAIDNGRHGFNISAIGFSVNCIATRNQNNGIRLGGGVVLQARLIDNGLNGVSSQHAIYCDYYNSSELFKIIDCVAPASANQIYAIGLNTTDFDPREKVVISGKNIFTGYGNNLYFVNSGDNIKTPITNGNIITHIGTSTNPIYGRATLSSGTVTVTTNAVRDYAPSGTTGYFTTKVDIKPITFTHTGALYVSAITDATSFVVTSTNGAGTQQFEYHLAV